MPLLAVKRISIWFFRVERFYVFTIFMIFRVLNIYYFLFNISPTTLLTSHWVFCHENIFKVEPLQFHSRAGGPNKVYFGAEWWLLVSLEFFTHYRFNWSTSKLRWFHSNRIWKTFQGVLQILWLLCSHIIRTINNNKVARVAVAYLKSYAKLLAIILYLFVWTENTYHS